MGERPARGAAQLDETGETSHLGSWLVRGDDANGVRWYAQQIVEHPVAKVVRS